MDTKVKKISKKEARAVIYNRLADALSEFKNNGKPKSFESKLKKASKLFARDVAKAKTQTTSRIKRTNKKSPKAKKSAEAIEKGQTVTT